MREPVASTRSAKLPKMRVVLIEPIRAIRSFDRYAELLAQWRPSSFCAPSVDEMVIRARNVLRLLDVPDSRFGGDKRGGECNGEQWCTLMLPGGAHGKNEPLMPSPCIKRDDQGGGGTNNDWDHRDATFEEIFHLVHDAGIVSSREPAGIKMNQAEAIASLKMEMGDPGAGVKIGSKSPGKTVWRRIHRLGHRGTGFWVL